MSTCLRFGVVFGAVALFATGTAGADPNGTPRGASLAKLPPRPVHARSGPLAASMIIASSSRAAVASIVISNSSGDFQCIDVQMLDPAYQHIRLTDDSGKVAWLNSYAETRPNPLLGFEYSESYLFILPRETRSFDVDLQAFRIRSGSYRYELVFLYYRCEDVVSKSRIAAGKDIVTYAVQAEGTVMIADAK